MGEFKQIAATQFPEFKLDEVALFIEQFKFYDSDNSGSIDNKELEAVMNKVGEKATPDQLKKIIAEVDTDGNGTVEFAEFLSIIRKLRSGQAGESRFGAVYKKAEQLVKISGAGGSEHTFSEEEKQSFVDFINEALKADKHVGVRLPINAESMDFFTAVKDGLVLCKLINYAVADTIDERVLNTKKNMNAFEMNENHALCINSAKSIGCNVINIGPQDLQDGKVHLILGLIWQIIKIGLLSKISLNNVPELFRLLEPGETIEALLRLPPEAILLRWINYHLKNAGSARKVNNFSNDIKDSEAYTILLNQLDSRCNKAALNESDPTKRAELVLTNADILGCRKFVRAKDIVKGNPKLNLAFVANLFNTCPGLAPLTEEERAQLDEWLFGADSEQSREARTFCLWINSLGVDPFVQNLFVDLRDGIIILKVMEIIKPGVVDWKKVNTKTSDLDEKTSKTFRFKRTENNNYAVQLGGKSGPFQFSLVGISGSDITEGNVKLTLALVWQLMRAHVLQVLSSLGKIDESEMVARANRKVKDDHRISDLRDKKQSTSHFYIDLLDALRPKTVNFELVTPGESEEDKILNAKYAISVARKIGASIFILPEDVVEVKPKMLLTFLGAIMATKPEFFA
jgi:plastin-1